MKRLHAKVHGRVQGVGFRAFVHSRAQALRLTGFARNVYIPRRYVEVVAEGSESSLKQLLAHLHRGPSLAYVERVDVTWEPPSGEFSHFRIT